MNVEMEAIENVHYNEPRSISWVCDLIRSLGRNDPFTVLDGMWNGGFIQFVDVAGDRLFEWKVKEILRIHDESSRAFIVGTKKGADWAENPVT